MRVEGLGFRVKSLGLRVYDGFEPRLGVRSALARVVPLLDPHQPSDVPAFAFRVQGSELRVQGSGFRVQGAAFRVQGGEPLGCKIRV